MTANSPLGQYIPMKLHVWLEKNKRTASWLAGETGLSVTLISRIMERSGVAKRSPSMETCAKISAATNGEVTADDFMPLSAPRKGKNPDCVAA